MNNHNNDRKKKTIEREECIICFEDCIITKKIVPKCLHFFEICHACRKKIIIKNRLCPVCRIEWKRFIFPTKYHSRQFWKEISLGFAQEREIIDSFFYQNKEKEYRVVQTAIEMIQQLRSRKQELQSIYSPKKSPQERQCLDTVAKSTLDEFLKKIHQEENIVYILDDVDYEKIIDEMIRHFISTGPNYWSDDVLRNIVKNYFF